MTRSVLLIGAISAALATREASADPGVRVQFAVDTGFVLPYGGFGGLTSLQEFYVGFIPVRLEVGARITPSVFVGGVFQYAWALTKACDSCSGSDLYVGLEVIYHFKPEQSIDPWLGISSGYQVTRLHSPTNDYSIGGLQLLSLRLGLDVPVSQKIRLSPFAETTFGNYLNGTASVQEEGGPAAGDTFHVFLMLGLRCSMDL